MMFSQKQVEFMKSIGLDMDFLRLSDDDYCKIEDTVGDIYTEEAQEHPDEVTEKILICESILDMLSEDDE
ncbi:hypothetical protein ADH75_02945 [Flavonifractor plautii]|uniref:Uncharacterized protein n=1 Tax=Flavonifractor plautii TaxID=292800 RepID=A0AAX1KGI0_FLAPL|nr:hypothetical protein [Flavonifractor plautii]WAK79800.1 hypothetical protein [Flavonifractor phage Chenonceau]DAL91102.1 MAG TPA: hypothetical protein [Caudoviricetes sp.]ANU42196.1 hypothetical protein A4U99_14475 [Flavonifractor plautii]OXE48548.1 hypothetical protein ADH75_02945 [Flavonifractor plautii]QQR04919.1 hypothetical protein I5Q84_13140 [Flavonifractor plautii]